MVNIKIIVDRETGRSKGYGFVSYSEPLGESGRRSGCVTAESACLILLLVGWMVDNRRRSGRVVRPMERLRPAPTPKTLLVQSSIIYNH